MSEPTNPPLPDLTLTDVWGDGPARGAYLRAAQQAIPLRINGSKYRTRRRSR